MYYLQEEESCREQPRKAGEEVVLPPSVGQATCPSAAYQLCTGGSGGPGLSSDGSFPLRLPCISTLPRFRLNHGGARCHSPCGPSRISLGGPGPSVIMHKGGHEGKPRQSSGTVGPGNQWDQIRGNPPCQAWPSPGGEQRLCSRASLHGRPCSGQAPGAPTPSLQPDGSGLGGAVGLPRVGGNEVPV